MKVEKMSRRLDPSTQPPQSATTEPVVTATAKTSRVNSVDLLRGLVMVIMLLDHTRDFVHADSLNFDPTDPTKTTFAIFFTRWITHFCAPTFVFLAGAGAYLQTMRGKSRAELSRFLVTRGLWLVVLELTVIRALVWFNLDYHFAFMLQVIWVIGVGMILLAALVHLPLRAIAAFGVAMIVLHNLLDKIQVTSWRGPGTPAPGFWASVWMLLHQQGFVLLAPNVYGFIVYPLIPWVGVIAAGYVFGAVYEFEPERRRRFLLRLGAVLVVAFLLLRAVNIYGDPNRWSAQKNIAFTALSFLNTTKYPPSLLYLLMTLGPACLCLAWFERLGKNAVTGIFITFGRVPLFFYIGQWIAAHGLGVLFSYLAGKPTGWLFGGIFGIPSPNPGNLGFSLWVVYAAWFTGLLLLYPLCRWFAGVKRRRKDWWLSYL